ncbi:MAG: asparaginase [Gemmatimonadota bacterium]
MSDLHIEATRGDLVESVHRVSVAVVDGDGRLMAESGDPDLVTFWRSAAKPFQAMPLVMDGAADHFGLTPQELALCCASHSSEPEHLTTTDSILGKLGLTEAALACGPHTPLSSAVAEEALRGGVRITPRWSNCSGKHSGMLALALHHHWPTEGYNLAGHPVQNRILDELTRWTDLSRDDVFCSVDGCNTVCFALPLRGMATAYARFGVSSEEPARRLREAMLGFPHMVGGMGRPCTDLMRVMGGRLVAKVGAEGVYSAALPEHGIGISLKAEDGDMRTAPIALVTVVNRILTHLGDATAVQLLRSSGHLPKIPIRNTRGLVTGALSSAGDLRFL